MSVVDTGATGCITQWLKCKYFYVHTDNRQTKIFSSERVLHKVKTTTVKTVTNIWSWAPVLTDSPSVVTWLWLEEPIWNFQHVQTVTRPSRLLNTRNVILIPNIRHNFVLKALERCIPAVGKINCYWPSPAVILGSKSRGTHGHILLSPVSGNHATCNFCIPVFLRTAQYIWEHAVA
jgi:hypothetical protein